MTYEERLWPRPLESTPKNNWLETLKVCYQLFPIEPQGNDAIPVLLAFRKGIITKQEFDELKFNCFGAAYFTEKTKWT